ncbi:hypothetical protein HDU93_000377 [Gonapodya sp. JEL0774]|nr:hypothetical protein HDU93_000377 [Gonapodya sp. JEL0774]
MFCIHPYALPCMVAGSFSAVGFFLGIWLLEETRKFSALGSYAILVDNETKEPAISGVWMESGSCDIERDVDGIMLEPPFLKRSPSLSDDPDSPQTLVGDDEFTPALINDQKPHRGSDSRRPRIARNSRLAGVGVNLRRRGCGCSLSGVTMWAVLAYLSVCFFAIVFEEMVPVFANSSRELGGLAFTSRDIGTIMTAQGVAGILSQLFVFPRLERHFGVINTYCASLTVSSLVAVSTPFFGDLNAHLAFTEMAFTSSIIMVNDSAPAAALGQAHGVSQMMAAFTRAAGPTIGGGVYAWTLRNGLTFPLDRHFLFIALGIQGLLSWLMAWKVKREWVRNGIRKNRW